ncbi:MAG: hypothetical protein MOGMAGMI_02478 [Candidatus Omnitrophica bacterium]|nr:hypothetical protein [Candidatus Omnitrophota bacterium]
MSATTTVLAAIQGTSLRTAINAGLTAAGVPTFADPTVAHPMLLGVVGYAPRLPALAAHARQIAGRPLATGHNVYQATLRVRFTAAIAHTTEAAAQNYGAIYIDVLRAVVMTKCHPGQASPVGGFEDIRWVGSDPDGTPFANDTGVVSRQVTVEFDVIECIAAQTA